MTTQIDLDKLEQVARAATPGETTFGSCNLAIKMDGWYHVLARCVEGGTDSEEWLANAAFWQAANPAAVLELVRRLRAAEADAKRREDYIEALHADHGMNDDFDLTAFARRIEAASGPNAALIEALQTMLSLYTNPLGITEAIIMDNQKFGELMKKLDHDRDAIVENARAALAAASVETSK